jgi:hypothetical protein
MRLPPDGAVVPVDPNGIRVTYTCPGRRLRHGKVSGRVELSVGSCSGSSAYSAARV